MSISRNEIISIINSLDAINSLNELQELLQVVVEQPQPLTEKTCRRIQVISEIYLTQSTPWLQNLTINLERLQKYYKEVL